MKISTGTVEKRENGELNARIVSINASPVVISTSFADDIEIVREQLYNKFFKIYVYPRGLNLYNVIQKIVRREELEYPFEVKSVVMCFLSEMPKSEEISDELVNALHGFASKVLTYTSNYGVVFGAVEMLRNFVKVHAVINFKTVAYINYFNAVMNEFYNEILFDALGLTERDIKSLRYVRNAGELLKTDYIFALAKTTKQYIINVLKELERKGLVYSDRPNSKKFIWGLTELGQRVLNFGEAKLRSRRFNQSEDAKR
ncbi:hypothetical protein BFU36_11410 [Sulfolobus sp. A20]|uniref:hypothetical protein n=2 Tax=Sulfolobaceae TaxID=118883 RepID=UPI000845CBAA|nr:hypothetical protein [Sulfolobus sp. A20]TRM75821.1 hypothetical protein DJ523_02215 [Sulfolobus sp. E5]TRM77227.1 hypothetical protein DJ528_07035 [Sulfolobus sp. B5]TRM81667.1 hypothetical protein DJ524_03235 [Sulfolobus sp. D5]TRM84095.1 hypothetical protein DJ531_02245 [Sulfolobus sp. A20-N-F6]TRM86117.1 hypothetical protein DJ529_12025 [Sulfolobus sp. C3]TRM89231.1 hypothetical protein DJ521_00355 [Sulfolobus sp. E3]TRM95761.1 hypothetical protein DMP16_08470 [Sulfolobus sp. B1]TRN0